jgi:GT2 family glycosyltransferase
LDEDYFYYFEESDLCWRTILIGYDVYFSPNSIVLHKGGGTFRDRKLLYHRSLHGKLLYHRQKNTIVSMIKCYECGNLIKYMSLRIVFELAGIVYLFFKEPSLAISNLKAVGWVIRNIEKVLRKREKVQKMRTVADRELFERGFINKSLKLTFEYTKTRLGLFEAA